MNYSISNTAEGGEYVSAQEFYHIKKLKKG